MAALLATVAILHTFQYSRGIIGKVYVRTTFLSLMWAKFWLMIFLSHACSSLRSIWRFPVRGSNKKNQSDTHKKIMFASFFFIFCLDDTANISNISKLCLYRAVKLSTMLEQSYLNKIDQRIFYLFFFFIFNKALVLDWN